MTRWCASGSFSRTSLVCSVWLWNVINPRRTCARVTVVCVCVSVHGSNLLVAQLHDKLVILTGSAVVPEWIWRFSYNAFVAIALPYLQAHGSRPFFIRETGSFSAFLLYIYYARDFTVCGKPYTRMWTLELQCFIVCTKMPAYFIAINTWLRRSLWLSQAEHFVPGVYWQCICPRACI